MPSFTYFLRSIIYNLTISMETKAVLKVYEEVSFFKSSSNFILHYKPRYLFELFQAMALGGEEARRLTVKVQRQMNIVCIRSVFASLKWMNFHHQLLHNANSSAAIETTISSLEKMSLPNVNAHFEQYIILKLLSPYKQYLIKLAEIMQNNFQGRSPQKGENRQENSDYCLYNLLAFAIKQFSVSLKQFSRFFHRFFPCLNEYLGLVGRDCNRLMKRLRNSYEKGLLPTLTFLEVQQMDSQLLVFTEQAARLAGIWIFPPTNAVSMELEEEGNEIREEKEVRALQPLKIANNR